MEEIKAEKYHYSLTCLLKLDLLTPPEKYLEVLYLLSLHVIVSI